MTTAKNIVLLVLMLLSAALGAVLRPTISLADERPPIDLAAMVPTAFGDWREEVNLMAQVVNPQQRKMLEETYSAILNRTYVNAQGYRVMLSIAYGKNQRDALQLHQPEACYPAQGFTLHEKQVGSLDLLGRPIPATRLATSMGQRFEPVTYWAVVGDSITTFGLQKKWIELRYALHNRIPDGMLVRVSSIDKGTDNAYTMQNQFATAMVAAISEVDRSRFAGNLTSPVGQVPLSTLN